MKPLFSTLLFVVISIFSQALMGQSIPPQTYGNTGISEVLHHFVPAPNGGYFLTGAEFSKDAAGDSWLVATDAAGQVLWQWAYGGAELDGGNAVLPLADGGALMVGHSESYERDCDGIAARFSADGALLWHIAIGEAEDDAFYDVQQMQDGGFLCIGLTEGYGAQGEDAWLVKLDPNGNHLWTKHYGGLWDDFAFKITPAADGGFWLAGITFSLSDNQRKEMSLMKIDANGDLQQTYAYHLLEETVAYCITVDAAGNPILAGNGRVENGNYDVVIAKVDGNTGELVWIQTYGGPAHDEVRGVLATTTGEIVVAGFSNNLSTPAIGDAFIMKINNDGEKMWLQKAGGLGNDDARAIYELADGHFVIAGKTEEGISGIYNGYMMTLNAGGITLIDKNSPMNPPAPVLVPNPVRPNGRLQIINPEDFAVGIKIFDLTGRLHYDQSNVLPGNITLSNHQLSTGMYIVEMSSGPSGKVIRQEKLVVE